jgi:glycosyltransferase involved in cell wall biosynthesis
MHITVILCTYNRSASLRHALTSATSLVLPESVEWEVLVVDNNSADQTRNVVEDFCKQYPGRFRYLFEAKPGKSNALNAGIREARGDVLAFTDDDITLHPMWLQNLTSALHNHDWAGVGGRILQRWDSPPPRWLHIDGRYWRMSWPLTSFDMGEHTREGNANVNGANMAFHKDVFAKYGGFRTDLGPQPGNEIRCEDTEFGHRLYFCGERVGYEPSAIVYHPVSQSRLTKMYFLTWWFDYGCATVKRINARRVVWGLGSHLRVPKIACRLAGRALLWTLALDPARRFYHKVGVWETAGALVESYRQSRAGLLKMIGLGKAMGTRTAFEAR